ncbi:hypothetical protein LTR91_026489 [Friedmanniomyces endolithicus]|uniref:Uncharacterized protein n=1 Tax=Friedmanniomyces endolithicus TaxID=329885 RepID=A0AAN6J1I4_9PEZI|nr:hypothetical protein LTS09_015534 [Friedmanniomyces endolithicus]KAK0263133.1 hypothetical protein LTR35_017587 [Friedmanniomyces endolithicus]KAK0276692.1 hypothetical protein LTS00_014545 [Friedmanniomyces endolithicus]KAK0309092.1 hypothetical protein LTR82_015259 [Friedmanniomyces endolithicus]KAK0903019.1 hypothetical protein LTR57_019422 [Friedmanniomyces endolithicus]
MNVTDLLKLFVVYALRQGAIAGATSAEEAVYAVDPAGIVQWAFPARPVFCAHKRQRFDYTKGADSRQLAAALDEAAATSGVAERLRPMDIRRGAAKDAGALKAGPSLSNASAALNHSSKSTELGITKRYMGPNPTSTFSDRLWLPDHIMGIKAVDTRTVAGVTPRSVTSAMLNEYISRLENSSLLVQNGRG